MTTNSQGEFSQERDADDTLLAMLGVGKQLWESEDGDAFVERLRFDP